MGGRNRRDAKPSRQTQSEEKQKAGCAPGIPVAARLVVSRVLSDDGDVLAECLLLTNVQDVDASTLALWYYWRWQIECFFKLVKSAGHHLESWQQESALAIAKRLLVASMACVTVWAAVDKSKEAAEFKTISDQTQRQANAPEKGVYESSSVVGAVGLPFHA